MQTFEYREPRTEVSHYHELKIDAQNNGSGARIGLWDGDAEDFRIDVSVTEISPKGRTISAGFCLDSAAGFALYQMLKAQFEKKLEAPIHNQLIHEPKGAN